MRKRPFLIAIGMAAILSLNGCNAKDEPSKEQIETQTETQTQTQTEVQTETQTEVQTEVQTQASTEAPTEAPTEEATKIPKKEPTEKSVQLFEKRIGHLEKLYSHFDKEKIIKDADEVPESLKELYLFAEKYYRDYTERDMERLGAYIPIITLEDDRIVVYGDIYNTMYTADSTTPLLEDLSKLTVHGQMSIYAHGVTHYVDLSGLIVYGNLSIEGALSNNTKRKIESFDGLHVASLGLSGFYGSRDMPTLENVTIVDNVVGYGEKVCIEKHPLHITIRSSAIEEIPALPDADYTDAKLDFTYNKLKKISHFPTGYTIAEIDVSCNYSLAEIESLSDLDVKLLVLTNNSLESLPPINNTTIGSLKVGFNKLSMFPKLTNSTINILTARTNAFTELPNLKNMGISDADFGYNPIVDLHIDGLNIDHLEVSHSLIKNVSIKDSKIKKLSIYGNPLDGKIDVPEEHQELIEAAAKYYRDVKGGN